MLLTHLGHACVLIDVGGTRILIDPGTLSAVPDAERLDGILVTHRHPDHLDAAKIAALLAVNSQALLWVESSTHVEGIDADRVRPVASGDSFTVGGVEVQVVGGTHARIHQDIDLIPNVGFFFPSEGFLHPGDELFVPEDKRVRVLAAPISGPWQALEDAVDYVRAVGAEITVPIHEGMLARPQVYTDYLEKLAPGTRVVLAEPGIPLEL